MKTLYLHIFVFATVLNFFIRKVPGYESEQNTTKVSRELHSVVLLWCVRIFIARAILYHPRLPKMLLNVLSPLQCYIF